MAEFQYPILEIDTPASGEFARFAQNAGAPASAGSALSIYPNPTNGNFTLRSTDEGMFTVYSLQGIEIASFAIVRNENTIHFPSSISSGIYYGRFTPKSGISRIVKLLYQP